MTETNKNILIFDTEATGLNPDKEQIIELTVQVGVEDDSPQQTWRIKPSVPISKEAQEVHGISAADLVDCPKFPELEDEIRAYFDEADVIIGYNVEFDVRIIQAEFQRAKLKPLDLSKKLMVDPLNIWRKAEPRKLTDAFERFVGGKLNNAHSASADVRATGKVLNGMLKEFKLEKKSWKDLSDFGGSRLSTWIGPTKHFQWKEGKAVIGFGKHAGKTLTAIAQEQDGGYLKWMLGTDFPEHVKAIAQEALNKSPNDFEGWIKKEFG